MNLFIKGFIDQCKPQISIYDIEFLGGLVALIALIIIPTIIIFSISYFIIF